MGSKAFKNMEALKNQFAEQNLTKEVEGSTKTNVISKIEKSDNFLTLSTLDFSEINNWGLNSTETEFCKSKAQKIINHTANSFLTLGKEFEEIFQTFSNSGSKDGIYEKLVEYLGFNPKTVRRWRKRYSLFLMAKTQSEKELISTIPTNYIEKLSKLSESEINILLNNNSTKEELTKAINTEKLGYKEEKSDDHEKAPDTMSEGFNFTEDNILNIFDNFSEKIENLEDSKKEKLNKLILGIQKLLNS
ncbi:hypothetical protein [Fusobacterium sp. PH5-44]|uniref:hypothetical protein n=1 Tax=unclassified Fusobacterium TaxID=2648384 RepID=UPI003D22311A